MLTNLSQRWECIQQEVSWFYGRQLPDVPQQYDTAQTGMALQQLQQEGEGCHGNQATLVHHECVHMLVLPRLTCQTWNGVRNFLDFFLLPLNSIRKGVVGKGVTMKHSIFITINPQKCLQEPKSIDISTTHLSDHLKWRLVQQKTGHYVMSYCKTYNKPIRRLKYLCFAGYVHMQCLR